MKLRIIDIKLSGQEEISPGQLEAIMSLDFGELQGSVSCPLAYLSKLEDFKARYPKMKVKVDQYYMTFDDSQEAIDFFKDVVGDGTGVIESYFPSFTNMSTKFLGCPLEDLQIIKKTSIQEIPSEAFKGSSIKVIEFPGTLRQIHSDSFKGCDPDLLVILNSSYGVILLILGDDSGLSDLPGSIYIPDESLFFYTKDLKWSLYDSILESKLDLGHDCLEFADGSRMRFGSNQNILLN